jgi:ribose transport system permease protein
MSDHAATPAKTSSSSGFKIDFHIWGPVIALVVLVVAGAMMNPNFLSYGNVTNVLARSAFIGIIAVGMTFVITSGGLDLSVGSMAAFIAGVVGLAAGLVNGLLITQARIEAFIVTLGTMGIFRSLITWLADGGTLSLDYTVRELYRPVYYSGLFGVAWPIIVFAVIAIIGEIVMRHTAFGRHCAAIGSMSIASV